MLIQKSVLWKAIAGDVIFKYLLLVLSFVCVCGRGVFIFDHLYSKCF